MTPEERDVFIKQYAAGYDEVIDALNDFPAESLGAHPIPGKWSAREIVHHLGDSESTSAWRLRKLLVEDNPTIQGYDQDQFANRLRYNERNSVLERLLAHGNRSTFQHGCDHADRLLRGKLPQSMDIRACPGTFAATA